MMGRVNAFFGIVPAVPSINPAVNMDPPPPDGTEWSVRTEFLGEDFGIFEISTAIPEGGA